MGPVLGQAPLDAFSLALSFSFKFRYPLSLSLFPFSVCLAYSILFYSPFCFWLLSFFLMTLNCILYATKVHSSQTFLCNLDYYLS